MLWCCEKCCRCNTSFFIIPLVLVVGDSSVIFYFKLWGINISTIAKILWQFIVLTNSFIYIKKRNKIKEWTGRYYPKKTEKKKEKKKKQQEKKGKVSSNSIEVEAKAL